MTKAGYERPIVIVTGKKEVKPSHIRTNLITAGISRERYFELLKEDPRISGAAVVNGTLGSSMVSSH